MPPASCWAGQVVTRSASCSRKLFPQPSYTTRWRDNFLLGAILSWDGAAQHSLSHGKACPDPDQHVTKKKTSAFLAQCQRPHGKVPNLIFKHSEFGRHSCVIILSILWADHSTWKAKRSHEWAQSRRGTWFKLDLLFHSMIMIDMQSHQTTFQGVCVCSVLSHSHELWHDQIEFRATPHSTLSQI